jgi:hypothetical protein
LTDAEKAAVLDELMADDVELERRVEQAGRRLLATVTRGRVASAIAEALLALDQDDLAAHAGRTRYGYVEPTEAAWQLLEQVIEPWLEDLARRASLGLEKAPRQLGLGILEALDRVGGHTGNDELLLSWAPDFPGEAAGSVLRALTDVGIELTDADCARPIARG